MPTVNKCFFMGNVTRDIDLRHTPGGTAVAEVGLALNEKYKKNDKWEERVHFVDVVCWGRTAEVAAEFLSKGSLVFFECRVSQDKWQDKDSGENRYKIKFVAERLVLMPSGKGGGQGGSGKGKGGPKSDEYSQPSDGPDSGAGEYGGGDSGHGGYNAEDIPF